VSVHRLAFLRVVYEFDSWIRRPVTFPGQNNSFPTSPPPSATRTNPAVTCYLPTCRPKSNLTLASLNVGCDQHRFETDKELPTWNIREQCLRLRPPSILRAGLKPLLLGGGATAGLISHWMAIYHQAMGWRWVVYDPKPNPRDPVALRFIDGLLSLTGTSFSKDLEQPTLSCPLALAS